MAKLIDLPIEELYAKPKMTAAVITAIMSKEDFTKQSTEWCGKVCSLKCKSPPGQDVLCPTEEVDVLIVQNHDALNDDRYGRSGESIELKYRGIIRHLFKKAMEEENELGLEYSVANLTRCPIRGADVKKGKPPTGTHLVKCRPYLHQEILTRNPKVIVSLTTEASRAMGSKKSNSRNAGEISTISIGGRIFPLVLTLHPKALVMLRQNSSGAFWGPDFYKVIIRDFRKAIQLIRKQIFVPDLDQALEAAKKAIIICRSMDQVEYWAKELIRLGEEETVLSFDTETTGLDRYAPDAKVITLQFGWRREHDGKIVSVVFPMWHRKNIWYDPDKAWELLSPLLTREDILKIGHNAKYDITYLHTTCGIRVKGLLLDTMLLIHSLESGIQGMYGLKKSVWDWLPETELGGYEDKLPKLTKIKKSKETDEIDEDEEIEEC